MEERRNPLVAITLHFEDGVALRQRFANPVPQAMAMFFLGQMIAKLGRELDFEVIVGTEGGEKDA